MPRGAGKAGARLWGAKEHLLLIYFSTQIPGSPATELIILWAVLGKNSRGRYLNVQAEAHLQAHCGHGREMGQPKGSLGKSLNTGRGLARSAGEA